MQQKIKLYPALPNKFVKIDSYNFPGAPGRHAIKFIYESQDDNYSFETFEQFFDVSKSNYIKMLQNETSVEELNSLVYRNWCSSNKFSPDNQLYTNVYNSCNYLKFDTIDFSQNVYEITSKILPIEGSTVPRQGD